MRDRMKISTFDIDDIDLGVILYAGIEDDPSSIGRPVRSARVTGLYSSVAAG